MPSSPQRLKEVEKWGKPKEEEEEAVVVDGHRALSPSPLAPPGGGRCSSKNMSESNDSNKINHVTQCYGVPPPLAVPAPTASSTRSFVSAFFPTYKVLLVGDCGVGKSNLLSRFACNHFDIHTPPTLGVEFTSREVEVPTARVGQTERVLVRLWDTAGQERCTAISTVFFRNAVGAVLVYDVTRDSTLLRLPMWAAHVWQHACEDCVCIVLGNKTDLRNLRVVSDEEADEVAHALGMRHFTASALNGEGVTHAFMQLVLSLSAVQQAKRLAAVGTGKSPPLTPSDGAAAVSSASARRFPLVTFSPHTIAKGRQMDLRGFGESTGGDNVKGNTVSGCCM
ncbi:guanin nucleotide-binding protein [Trypanosoma grayi]|uniref:guanin nucleotide-binding protein n=1 Tax=Trypanosoma grayi TaxID=71804 RepID=UPI0004F4B77D|nr:guanin nucleotide-binding protein [Trypanosoma grayi]KEG10028.1 guanin nucleotide-binding protein [Trypanosoma grayi]